MSDSQDEDDGMYDCAFRLGSPCENNGEHREVV